MLTKRIISFEGENKQTQYVLGYRTDLYFHDYKLTKEIDENAQGNINTDDEIKRKKTIGQKLGRTFIRIDPSKEIFDVFEAINEIFSHIKQSPNQLTKKTLIYKVSMRLIGLNFKSNNTIKSNAIKYIVKKYCLIMSKAV